MSNDKRQSLKPQAWNVRLRGESVLII